MPVLPRFLCRSASHSFREWVHIPSSGLRTPVGEISLVNDPDPREVVTKWGLERFRQHRDPVFRALAVMIEDHDFELAGFCRGDLARSVSHCPLNEAIEGSENSPLGKRLLCRITRC